MSTREELASVGRLPEGLVYPELMHTGFSEVLLQNANAFNAASNGAIQLVPERNMGDYKQETFLQEIANLVTRRQVDASPANPAVTALGLDKEEHISVLVNRRIGPVQSTLDYWRKQGRESSTEVLSLAIGEQIAKAVQVDWLNTGLRALQAATVAQASQTVAATGTVTTSDLVELLKVYGDNLNTVRLWVMHSSVYFDLVQEQIASNITNISDFNIRQATPVTLGIPVLVTDSPALVDTSTSPFTYTTLGVREGGLRLLQAPGAPLIDTDVIHGQENLVVDLQGEHEYFVRLQGYKYDTANGGVNPDDATIATGTNWDVVATDTKSLAAAALSSE